MEEKQSWLLVACQWLWYKDEAERQEGRAGEYPGRRKGHRKAGAAAAAAAKTNGNGKDGQGKQALKRRKKEGR
jgi:hypothetical protein